RPAHLPRMKVIVGLGNPGREYEATRHNVGWWVVDHLAGVWHFDAWRRDGDSLSTTGLVGTKKVRLMKPQTFMNLSGQALRPMQRREGFDATNDVLIVVDEVAIPLGEYRLRASGSAGGHNGLKSVEAQLKTANYARLRVGIKPIDEHRSVGDLSDYVLHAMPRDERQIVESLYSRLVTAAEVWVTEGPAKAVSTLGR
ncbi:MAG: aminoacyl-tRNA hydrolase, partial [Gemmatimonadaceae bacterium]